MKEDGYDPGWERVLEPGRVARTWDGGRLADVLGGAGPDGFDRGVARAMAWLSWGSYAPYRGEGGRAELHAAMGVEERVFLDVEGVQSAVLRVDGTDDAVVVFRGTAGLKQWVYNVGVVPRRWDGEGKVHAGFATAWRAVREEIEGRLADRANGRVWVTGHSFGGALAVLTAGAVEGATTYTFGAPMVGNEVFAAAFPEDRAVWRCVLGVDVVSRLPLPVKELERFRYAHVGLEVPLQSGVVSRRDGALSLTELREAFEGSKPPPMLSDHAVGNYLWALR